MKHTETQGLRSDSPQSLLYQRFRNARLDQYVIPGDIERCRASTQRARVKCFWERNACLELLFPSDIYSKRLFNTERRELRIRAPLRTDRLLS